MTSFMFLSQHRDTQAIFYLLNRAALTEIFQHCDLDENGYLSRKEFDIFQMRTSGESCDDDAWDVMVGKLLNISL